MRTQFIKSLVIISCVSVIAALPARAQTERSSQKNSDFRITQKTTVNGQSFQSTTMIKGTRERTETNMGSSEMAMKTVNVTQCDLKRTIQINDQLRKFLITAMETGNESSSSPTGSLSGASSAGTTRGGVVTYTTNITDTGERKEMFGLTARHLKSTMMSEPSADACNKEKMRIDRDGWYVDLSYDFNCGFDRPPQSPSGSGAGCQDRVQVKRTGVAKLGFPLIETTTIYGPDGSVRNTTSREVLEISRQPLDPDLFDVPAGYTEARSQQEMYAAPSMAGMGQSGVSTQESPANQNESSGQKTSTGVRVGVVQINNKTKGSVSTDELRSRLISEISGSGLETVPLNALSLSEAQSEAKVKQCDYILLTDITSLKAASAGKKLGGFLGRATGVDSGNAGKSEARLNYKLFPTGSSSPTLDSAAAGNEDTQEASIGVALNQEASAVVAALRKQ